MKIQVKVKPNAKQQKIEELADGSFVIALKSPPVDGKANQELREILAKRFKVSKSEVLIKSGASSKHKCLEIPTIDEKRGQIPGKCPLKKK